jgi:hypothetical protein
VTYQIEVAYYWIKILGCKENYMSLDSIWNSPIPVPSTSGEAPTLTTAAANRTANEARPLDAPDRTLFSPADLENAEVKIKEGANTPNLSLAPERQAENIGTMKQAIDSSKTDAGAAKMKSYRALAKSVLGLSAAITLTTLLAVSTVATHGAAAPLLAVSSLVLANAIIDIVFAAINVARAQKDLPPVNAESYLQMGVVSVLRKMNVPEKVLDKLEVDVFKKLLAVYKFALTATQTILGLVLAVPNPAMLQAAIKIASTVVFLGGAAFEMVWPNSGGENATEPLSPEEDSQINSALASPTAKMMISALAEGSLQEETRPLHIEDYA